LIELEAFLRAFAMKFSELAEKEKRTWEQQLLFYDLQFPKFVNQVELARIYESVMRQRADLLLLSSLFHLYSHFFIRRISSAKFVKMIEFGLSFDPLYLRIQLIFRRSSIIQSYLYCFRPLQDQEGAE